jgi:hypothetical protein
MIMPIMRVSTSVALISRRIAGSFGAALVALDAAEVMLPPDPGFRTAQAIEARPCNKKPRRLAIGAAFFCFTPLENGQLSRRT